MIKLKNKENGKFIGTVSEDQLKYLIDQLEEEHETDQDYWLNMAQIEIFKQNNADPHLISMLEAAFDGQDELEIVWEKQ